MWLPKRTVPGLLSVLAFTTFFLRTGAARVSLGGLIAEDVLQYSGSRLQHHRNPEPGLQAQSRTLKERFRPIDPTIVSSAQEFLKAVRDGAIHIELRDHIDLTDTLPMENDENPTYILDEAPHIQSIRGNCTEQPSRRGLGIEGATLLGMKHAQCMLVTDARVMIAVDSLWLDGVYIRLKRRNMDTPLSFITAESTMWMTHVSIQGDGFGSTGSAFIAKYGSFYAEYSIFADLNETKVITVTDGGTASFLRCKFQHNALTKDKGMEKTAAIHVEAALIHNTAVRVEKCRFDGTDADFVFAAKVDNKAAQSDHTVEIFSDTKYDVWSIDSSGEGSKESSFSLQDKRIEEYTWGTGKIKIGDDYTYFGGMKESLPKIDRLGKGDNGFGDEELAVEYVISSVLGAVAGCAVLTGLTVYGYRRVQSKHQQRKGVTPENSLEIKEIEDDAESSKHMTDNSICLPRPPLENIPSFKSQGALSSSKLTRQLSRQLSKQASFSSINGDNTDTFALRYEPLSTEVSPMGFSSSHNNR